MDSHARQSSRAFTLIELMVVIGIIAILLSVSVAVGFRVSGSGKQRQTEQALRILDQALTEYIAANGGSNPKPYVLDPRPQNLQIATPSARYVQPIFDGRNGHDPSEEYINSVGLFIAQCKDHPSVMATLDSVPSKMITEYDADGSRTFGSWYNQQPLLLTVMDGWGRPIRYVHPAFAGTRTVQGNPAGELLITDPSLMGVQATMLNGIPYASDRWGISQVRRNGPPEVTSGGDSDGGIPVGGRPYFYSAGPDGDPSTIEDNVYTNAPKLPRM